MNLYLNNQFIILIETPSSDTENMNAELREDNISNIGDPPHRLDTIHEEDLESNHSHAASEFTPGMLNDLDEAEKTLTKQQQTVEDDTESIGTAREKLGLPRQSPPAPAIPPMQSGKHNYTFTNNSMTKNTKYL